MDENILENPGYYGILPSDVRYCKNLTSGEKVLFSEISALANMRGYCFATNSYFANLYDIHKNTVSKWISNLEDNGFIVSFNEIRKDGSIERRIKLDNIDPTKQQSKYTEKIAINKEINGGKPNGLPPLTVGFTPINHTVYHNSTSLILPINNSNNIHTDFQKNENQVGVELENKTPTIVLESISSKKEKKINLADDGFDNAWESYRRKGSKKKSIERWSKLSNIEKDICLDHIPKYCSTRELVIQKDFESYLLNKTFNDIIVPQRGYIPSVVIKEDDVMVNTKDSYKFKDYFDLSKLSYEEQEKELAREKLLRDAGFIGNPGQLAKIKKSEYDKLIKQYEDKKSNK